MNHSSVSLRKAVLTAISGGILALAAGQAQAISSYQLLIDASNPSAVVITATGSAAALNYNGNTANDGVDLLGFFNSNQSGFLQQFLAGSTLQGGNSGASYNDVAADDFSTGGGAVYSDLEMYVDIASGGYGNTENFSVTQAAFSGSWTIDFLSLGVSASALPTAGSSGNILSGYYGAPGVVIGTWQTMPVPEPSGKGLLALGALTLAVIIYRRKWIGSGR